MEPKISIASAWGNKPIAIFGAGWHGRTVLDVCKARRLIVSWFIDDVRDGVIDGVTVRGGRSYLSDKDFLEAHTFIVAVGDPVLRFTVAEEILKNGGKLSPPVVHASCVGGSGVQIGSGTVVMPQTFIGAGVKIGSSCIVNICASIAHGSEIGDYASINDGARITGSVNIGTSAYIGAGAVILPGLKIGSSSVVGAGAVVTKDVSPDVTVVGNPARIMQKHA